MSREIWVTLLLGGIAALDAAPVAQTLVSQPLVTATVLGWVWGDMRVALEIGIVLQILAASTLPVGARTPEDYAVGGVVGTGVGLALASQQVFGMVKESSAMLGVFAGLLAAMLGVPLLKWQRRRNEGLARWAEDAVRAGRTQALGEAQWAGVVLAFGVGVSSCAFGMGLGVWLFGPLADHQSLRLSRAWGLAQPLWLGLGLAQLLHAFVQRRLARAAAFGFALVAAWLALMVGTR